MASLAELMYQGAVQNISDTKANPQAIAQSYQAGVALAQKKQQLAQQQEQLKQAQQQAKLKGVDKVLDIYKNADKFKNEADARRYIKYAVPAAVEAYGVVENFPPEMQEMLEGSREARQAAFIIKSKVQRGLLTAEEGMQALSMAQLPEYVEEARLLEAEKFAQGEKGKDIRSKDRIEETRTTRFVNLSKDINKQVESRFKKLDEQKEGARTAYGELTKIKEDLNKGKKASQISFNAASRGLAKVFNSGAMTDRDVADFRNITGLENFTIDAINKWLTGDVNPAAVEQLLNLTVRIGDRIDNESQTKARSVEPLFGLGAGGDKEQLKELSGINAKLEPTIPREGDDLGIPKQEIPILSSVYAQLTEGGMAPKEAFQKLKEYLTLKMGKEPTDTQVNNIVRQFQNKGK